MNFKILNIICLFITSIFVIGCSKSDDRPSSSSDKYYLEMKMNGIAKNFNTAVAAQTASDNENIVYIDLVGTQEGLPEVGFELEIQFLENNITIGTYYQPEPNGDPNYELSAKFYDTNTNTYFNSFYNDPEEFTITITEITESVIQGIFSGKIKNLDTQEVITVSEGSFKVPVQN